MLVPATLLAVKWSIDSSRLVHPDIPGPILALDPRISKPLPLPVYPSFVGELESDWQETLRVQGLVERVCEYTAEFCPIAPVNYIVVLEEPIEEGPGEIVAGVMVREVVPRGSSRDLEGKAIHKNLRFTFAFSEGEWQLINTQERPFMD